MREDYDGAEQMHRRAIELDPQDARAHFILGNLLGRVREDYDGAEQMYCRAIELDPQHAALVGEIAPEIPLLAIPAIPRHRHVRNS